jgi:hypothetical protein
MPPYSSVYDAGAFLKKWVRDLPEPILAPPLVNRLLDNDNPDSIRSILQGLSDLSRKTFAMLCAVVRAILAKSEVNHMAFKNLSLCFLDSITQNSKGLDTAFPLKYVFGNCLLLLNEDGTDFDLQNEIPASEAVQYEPPEPPQQGPQEP